MKTNIQYSEGAHHVIRRISSYAMGNHYAPTQFLDEESQFSFQRIIARKMRQQTFGRESIASTLRELVSHRACPMQTLLMDCRASRDCMPRFHTSYMQRIRGWPLTPDEYKYDRAVGVEIECFRPRSRNVELPLWARTTDDRSLRNAPSGHSPIEYRVLIKRSELELRLHRMCSLISDHKVNTSCGLHVHLDCRGRTESDVRAIAKRMTAWMIALQEFVPESRRNNTDYCALSFSERDRYRAINFTAFAEHKTLEVRLHSGTVDYTKIIAWIRLCELLFALKSKPKDGAQGLAALSQLPLTEYERSYWVKRHAQLNPRQYPTPTPSTESE